MHGHQLDGSNPQLFDVTDNTGVSHSCICSAQVRRNIGVQIRNSANMRLIDDRVGEGSFWLTVIFPVEIRVDDDCFRHGFRRIHNVEFAMAGIVKVIRVQSFIIVDSACDSLRIGVEEKLMRVATLAMCRVPWSINAVAITLARVDSRHIHVPHFGVTFFNGDSSFFVIIVEEAELNSRCYRAKECEIGAFAIEIGTQWIA